MGTPSHWCAQSHFTCSVCPRLLEPTHRDVQHRRRELHPWHRHYLHSHGLLEFVVAQITGTSQPLSRTATVASPTFFCSIYCESLSLHDHKDVKTTVKIYKRGTPRTAGSCRCKKATTSNHRRDLHLGTSTVQETKESKNWKHQPSTAPPASLPHPPRHDTARESNEARLQNVLHPSQRVLLTREHQEDLHEVEQRPHRRLVETETQSTLDNTEIVA